MLLERGVFLVALSVLVGAGWLLPTPAAFWVASVGALLAWGVLKAAEQRASGEGYREGWRQRALDDPRTSELARTQREAFGSRAADSGESTGAGVRGTGD